MATLAADLSSTPVQLTAAASTSIIAQNVWDGDAYLAVVAGNSAPTGAALQVRFVLGPRVFVTLALGASETLWGWCDDPELPDGPAAGRIAYQVA